MQTVTPQAFQRINAESAEDIFKFDAPAAEQISRPTRAYFRINALGQPEVGGANAPGALAGVALLADMAAQRDESGGADVNGVSAEGDSLSDIAAATDASRDNERSLMPDALLPQTTVHRGERQLNGDANVIADYLGRGAGCPAQSVDNHDIRPAADDTAGDGGSIMHGGNFYRYRLGIVGRLFERINKLRQVFDGINIMLGGRRNSVGALGNHARQRYVRTDLLARQMPADARLGALAYFNFYHSGNIQVIGMHAETPGSHLNNSIIAVLIQTGV